MTMRITCGVDEAGRGPLAGAVYAAAVILDPARPILGLNDSKKLSEKKRDSLALEIKEYALAWAIASSSVEEIDEINILQASLLAMKRAVESLRTLPELVLVDGLHCPRISITAEAIVQGDSKVPEIAAASILAKTHRDHLGAQARDAGREVSLYRGPMPAASSAALAAHLLGKETSPTQAAVRAERLLRLQEALNALDPLDREILSLRHFEELTHAEAAQVLEIGEAAAAKRYVRALKRLKDILAAL